MRILITGASGSGAFWLIDFLRKNHPEVEIFGTSRKPTHNQHPCEKVKFYEVDMLDYSSVWRCLDCVRPRAIFHYACNPDKGFKTPAMAIQVPALGTTNLLEAVRTLDTYPRPRVINVSSAEVYGYVPEEIPLSEDYPKQPLSPYAIGKLAQDNLGFLYHKAYDLDVVTLRTFSYINPKHKNLFTSQMARQIAEIEQEKRVKGVTCGNLSSKRSFLDCRDVARAFWTAFELCDSGEAYNIGGTNVYAVEEIVDKLIAKCSLKYWNIEKLQNCDLLRPADISWQIPNVSKFQKLTNWEPEIGLDDSFQWLLDYYRQEVKNANN